MKLAENHRRISEELALYGIKPEVQLTHRQHVLFRWKVGEHTQSMTVGTKGDHRAGKNNVAKVRRLLREAGVEIASAPPRDAPPTWMRSFEERLARLEADVRLLLDRLTDPAGAAVLQAAPIPEPPPPEPAPAPAPEPPPPARTRKPGGRKMADYAWLWRVLRYDDYLTYQAIAKATACTPEYISVLLNQLKKRGLVEHLPRIGWRKHRSVEQLGRGAPPPPIVSNGRAKNGMAAHH